MNSRHKTNALQEGLEAVTAGIEAGKERATTRGGSVAEQRTEGTIRVRQVTDVQFSWSEEGRGE